MNISFSLTECLTIAFVLTMCFRQVRMIKKHKLDYFRKWWNAVLITMLIGFLASVVFWIIGSSAVRGWSATNLMSGLDLAGHKILLISKSLFSISSVISVFYLGSLCQVNSVFGPLQLSTIRMIKDILKFLTIFLGVFFAFTLGVRSLYSHNRSLESEYLEKNSTTNQSAEELSRYVHSL